MSGLRQDHLPSVLVTGASGFVGNALSRRLSADGFSVTSAVRQATDATPSRSCIVGELGPDTDWSEALPGVDVVVHLAARVHVMKDAVHDPLAAFRQVNVTGTVALARAAAAHGVKRFIFMSSIKVNGERTVGAPFGAKDRAMPQDPYAISKWEAEQALMKISAETGMEVVILRPPLVYGPHVKANFLRLLRWVDHRVPLPLASVRNRRSMIYLGNLVDAILTCIDHPAVAGQTYLLSDGEDVSTPDLIRQMAGALGKSARLWPLPEVGLRTLGALSGKRAEVDRLLDSLQVDSRLFRQDTGWQPPFTLAQGLAQTVGWYREAYGR